MKPTFYRQEALEVYLKQQTTINPLSIDESRPRYWLWLIICGLGLGLSWLLLQPQPQQPNSSASVINQRQIRYQTKQSVMLNQIVNVYVNQVAISATVAQVNPHQDATTVVLTLPTLVYPADQLVIFEDSQTLGSLLMNSW
ncbi:MAG TPA: hypothetical protein DEF47_08270 [Herpetosiphon sp.]|uniref:Uncharacterized protein n=1 Tax=Herpetosiphon aurantiacus (strain ATCC 23779 / DSM 785 / 114-95) TaxID=316274 RepID=A9AUI6_HERA2|nr:hypothetical protein [Herpetosiphon sp.]ABX04513.1 hypothetical protein Haur_1870 [Herpetosiphon aurantiacus DSM 785]HBW49888.1 hypothetical protein [Herpetosiphon sp.]